MGDALGSAQACEIAHPRRFGRSGDTCRMSKERARRSKVLDKLASATEDRALVCLSRSIRRGDTLDGFVVGIGKEWVLLANLDPNIYLNGFVAIRICDVSKVKRPSNESF